MGLISWWNKKICHRLLILFTLTLTVFLVLLGYLSYRTAQKSMQYEVEQGNKRLATFVAKDIRGQYDTIVYNAHLLQYELEPPATLPLQVRTMLELRRVAPLTYRALYLFDRAGQLQIHLADPLEELLTIQNTTEIIDRPPIHPADNIASAYEEAKKGTLYLSGAQILGADQVPVVTTGIPIMAEDGQWGQVAVVEIDLRDIWRRIDEIYVGQTGRAFVVSKEGTIIAHPDRSYIGQPLPPALAQVLAGYEGQTEYIDPITGKTMLASYSPVGRQSGWGIVIEQEQTEVLAPINWIAIVTAGIVLAAIVMSMLVSIMIARSITHPIQHLAQVTQTITRTGDLNQNIVVKSQDEVGQLAVTFNQMMDSLRQAISQRDGALEILQNHSERLEEKVIQRTQALQDAQETLIRIEKLAALGEMAGSVAHELRNPLGVLANAIFFLKMTLTEANDQTKEYLDIISSEIHRSEKIIRDLLGFSRTRLTEKKEREAVAVSTLVTRVLAQHPPPEQVEICAEIDSGLPPIFVNPQQIEQVLTNLVSNAYQAMPAGGKLTIEAEPDEDNMVILLRDTGVGVSPENINRIFEPLFTTKAKGIGLGLAVSRNLVEANGGSIEVKSEQGRGSSFTVKLPLTI